MSDPFGASFRQNNPVDFGRQLMSWVYKPQKSNKFLFYILGLLGAAAIFLFTYGAELVPWLDKFPQYAIYIVFLLIGPALNFMRSLGKDQEWTLYENGFEVYYLEKSKGQKNKTTGHWRDYKSATYGADFVLLIPSSAARRKLKIRIALSVMEVYSLCRERISLAQAENLQNRMRRPQTPNTPEQRRVAQMERHTKRHSRASGWSR